MLAKTPTLNPTEEQLHILSLAKANASNLQINALAGSGKSSTLRMIANTVKTKPILYLVFNKRNAEEAEYKAQAEDAERRMPSWVSVRTLNALGHRIWAQKMPSGNLKLNKDKSRDILKAIIEEAPKNTRPILWDSYWQVLEAIGLTKALGYVPKEHPKSNNSLCDFPHLNSHLDEPADDLTQDLIDEVLSRSIKASYEGTIDFNDQIYMPALFGGVYPKFPLVCVDEEQDLNPCNHQMLLKLVGNNRLIGVGDPAQSIYGFRGAVEGGMEKLREAHQMQEATLSVSFRCPRAIVENARWRVPSFKYAKDGGTVDNLKSLTLDSIMDTDVIICRNNAPLFKLAIRLLMSKRSVSVGGSDVGPKLLATMKRLGSDDMSQSQVLGKISEWLDEKLAKGSKSAQDIADCMKVFSSYGPTLSSAVAYAEHLFSQRGAIRLMTGHKSKGLEFPTVYFLDPWLCGPSEQDLNLKYVVETRSMDKLFMINSKDIN